MNKGNLETRYFIKLFLNINNKREHFCIITFDLDACFKFKPCKTKQCKFINMKLHLLL